MSPLGKETGLLLGLGAVFLYLLSQRKGEGLQLTPGPAGNGFGGDSGLAGGYGASPQFFFLPPSGDTSAPEQFSNFASTPDSTPGSDGGSGGNYLDRLVQTVTSPENVGFAGTLVAYDVLRKAGTHHFGSGKTPPPAAEPDAPRPKVQADAPAAKAAPKPVVQPAPKAAPVKAPSGVGKAVASVGRVGSAIVGTGESFIGVAATPFKVLQDKFPKFGTPSKGGAF